jgi:hypothetical protein
MVRVIWNGRLRIKIRIWGLLISIRAWIGRLRRASLRTLGIAIRQSRMGVNKMAFVVELGIATSSRRERSTSIVNTGIAERKSRLWNNQMAFSGEPGIAMTTGRERNTLEAMSWVAFRWKRVTFVRMFGITASTRR